MARNKNKKQKVENKNQQQQQQQQQKKKKKKKKTKLNSKLDKKKPIPNSSDSDSSTPESQIQKLLEPFSKDQLVDFLTDASISDSTLLSLLRSTADRDISHRKIFVYGFGWDVTRETLISTFDSYGGIDECNVVVDKATGRAKGYGFVVFNSRSAASKALKQPQKQIKNRTAYCQLASVGPGAAPGAPGGVGVGTAFGDTTGRKIYVSNVHADANPDKLRLLFGRFGELEIGPLGFDQLTGKSRGFALFVYKTQDGARKALEEPYKMFEGHQLHCQMATDPAHKARPGAVAPQQPMPGPAALAAAAAAQNLALFTQNPTLNPALNALFANSGTGAGLGGYGHGLGGLSSGQSLLGPYGVHGQAMQGYQGSQFGQFGQSSSGRAYGGGGSLSGIPPYM